MVKGIVHNSNTRQGFKKDRLETYTPRCTPRGVCLEEYASRSTPRGVRLEAYTLTLLPRGVRHVHGRPERWGVKHPAAQGGGTGLLDCSGMKSCDPLACSASWSELYAPRGFLCVDDDDASSAISAADSPGGRTPLSRRSSSRSATPAPPLPRYMPHTCIYGVHA